MAIPAAIDGPSAAPSPSVFATSARDLDTAREQFGRLGFAVLGPGALQATFFQQLRSEASVQRQGASWPLRTGDGRSCATESNVRGHLGPVARRAICGSETIELMKAVTGEIVRPSWSASCYTWYDRPDAWLGRHQDKLDACYLTLIAGIESVWPAGEAPGPGNQLLVFSGASSKHASHAITTLPNRLVILNGKVHPHERPVLGQGRRVSVLCCCFRQGVA